MKIINVIAATIACASFIILMPFELFRPTSFFLSSLNLGRSFKFIFFAIVINIILDLN